MRLPKFAGLVASSIYERKRGKKGSRIEVQFWSSLQALFAPRGVVGPSLCIARDRVFFLGVGRWWPVLRCPLISMNWHSRRWRPWHLVALSVGKNKNSINGWSYGWSLRDLLTRSSSHLNTVIAKLWLSLATIRREPCDITHWRFFKNSLSIWRGSQ